MKRLAFLAIVAAAAFIARAEGEGYQNFYTVDDFTYPPLTGTAYLQDNEGQDKTVAYTMTADKNGNYSLTKISGGLPTVDSVFLTALNASLNAAKAYGEAMLAQAQTDKFAKNLANLLYTTGLEIVEEDGTTRTLTFDSGHLGEALRDTQNGTKAGATITGSIGGADGKSIEKNAETKKLQIKGFDTAQNTEDEFWKNYSLYIPMKKGEGSSISWLYYPGYNGSVFEACKVDGGHKGQLQLEGWDSPSCKASLNDMLSKADDSQNRRAHRILARYQEGSEHPSLHYIPIDDIIKGGGGGIPPDGESIDMLIDGSSTNLMIKGFAGAGGAKSSSSQYAPKIPYVSGGELQWISFGSMFGDAFAKPSDETFGLSINGLKEATGHQVLAADGSGSVFWRDVSEAEYTTGESAGDRHTVTFTKYNSGEAEIRSVYLPRINVETDEDGKAKIKWLDLNDESSTLHEFDLNTAGIKDFYLEEGWEDYNTAALDLVITDESGNEQTLTADIPVSQFEVTSFSTDSSDPAKDVVTMNGYDIEGEDLSGITFDIKKSQFDITGLALEVTDTTENSVSMKAKIDYKDQDGSAQNIEAPLTIPANLVANPVPLVDNLSIDTNTPNRALEIKGFAKQGVCDTTLKQLFTSTTDTYRNGHEILCRVGSGSEKALHYVPIGEILETPDSEQFKVDETSGKFKLNAPNESGKILLSNGDGNNGIEWSDWGEATVEELVDDIVKIHFVEHTGGEDNNTDLTMPRIRVEDDDEGNKILKWMDLNGSSVQSCQLGAVDLDETVFEKNDDSKKWSLKGIAENVGDSEHDYFFGIKGGTIGTHQQTVEDGYSIDKNDKNEFEIKGFKTATTSNGTPIPAKEGDSIEWKTIGDFADSAIFGIETAEKKLTLKGAESQKPSEKMYFGTPDSGDAIGFHKRFPEGSGAFVATKDGWTALQEKAVAVHPPDDKSIDFDISGSTTNLQIKGWKNASACGESVYDLITNPNEGSDEEHWLVAKVGESLHYLPFGESKIPEPDMETITAQEKDGETTGKKYLSVKPGADKLKFLRTMEDGGKMKAVWSDLPLVKDEDLEEPEFNGIGITPDAQNGQIKLSAVANVRATGTDGNGDGHKFKFESKDDSNVKIEVSKSGDEVVLKFGVYYK